MPMWTLVRMEWTACMNVVYFACRFCMSSWKWRCLGSMVCDRASSASLSARSFCIASHHLSGCSFK
eukprot:3505639-Karenia_brevis.AAC.1